VDGTPARIRLVVACAENNSLRQEHLAAFRKLRAAIRDLVALVDNSGGVTELEFDLAHLRIRVAHGNWEMARATLEYHQREHGF
jgi:hypothetical protein